MLVGSNHPVIINVKALLLSADAPRDNEKENPTTQAFFFLFSLPPTDYGHPERKKPSLHSQKLNPNPKFLGTAKGYFVCCIGPNFQISLICAFTGCPLSVVSIEEWFLIKSGF